jgi:hypothetical protein
VSPDNAAWRKKEKAGARINIKGYRMRGGKMELLEKDGMATIGDGSDARDGYRWIRADLHFTPCRKTMRICHVFGNIARGRAP